MGQQHITTYSPFWDTEKWTPGEWYPCPVGFFERDGIPISEYVIDGYMVFEYDTGQNNGDIIPVDIPGVYLSLSFKQALGFCEAKNNREMIKVGDGG